MSHDLRVGEIQEKYITEHEIWQHLNNFYYRSSVATSYKYVFFKALLENLYNVEDELTLSYDQIFYSFTNIYWNLIIHHQLAQSPNKNKPARAQTILQKYVNDYSVPSEWQFDQLEDSIQLKIVHDVKRDCKQNVIGAFYGDTAGVFYAFDIKRAQFRFNRPVYEFMKKYQRVLMNLTNYHLVKYLEKVNEATSTMALLSKIEVISKRSSLETFYKVLTQFEQNRCFYCHCDLSSSRRKTHVDHFIPWSFVQNDNLWNLVLACNACNLQKSDKIASRFYLETMLIRNDYLSSNINEPFYFRTYENTKLIDLYDYSIMNGYTTLWEPKKVIKKKV